VKVLLDQHVNQGYRQFSFSPRGMASGLYFLHIKASDQFTSMKKIVLVK